MKPSRKLLSKKERREIEYHLKGLAEAGALIERHTRTLKSSLDTDLEQAARSLADLEVQVFFHLDYHQKHLRRPFKRLVKLVYKRLDAAELAPGRSRKKKRPPKED